MKDLILKFGMFINDQFDKIVLVSILFATVYRSEDGAQVAKEICLQAFAALLGFMHGRATAPTSKDPQ